MRRHLFRRLKSGIDPVTIVRNPAGCVAIRRTDGFHESARGAKARLWSELNRKGGFRNQVRKVPAFLCFALLLLTTLATGQTFHSREPRETEYEIFEPSIRSLSLQSRQEWIQARRAGAISSRPSLFGRRLAIQVTPGVEPSELLMGRNLEIVGEFAPGVVVAEAPDVWTALRELELLLLEPDVVVASPVVRRVRSKAGAYAPEPDDPYYFRQWNLENRDGNSGASLGVDLNVRAAWPVSRGSGVMVAVADDGADMAHPDLQANLRGNPHFNFASRLADGSHTTVFQAHGTAIAGLIAAVGNNRVGMSGIAPEAKLASWVVWDTTDLMVSSEVLAEMFQYRSNLVSVQNHSWANSDPDQSGPTFLEQIGISNAVHLGRSGLGEVLVRAAGNGREQSLNANDDGYAADPQILIAGAVRFDGRVASYSSPGANLLVSAPSGDFGSGQPSIFTTDRVGTIGYNNTFFSNDLGDYAFDGSGFSGTSAAAPQIAAIAALALSSNTNLTWRDIQLLLVLTARPSDRLDGETFTNGAGLLVSRNSGFGVPDAGEMVRMATSWVNRPPQSFVEKTLTETIPIPDDSLRVFVSGPGVPAGLTSIPASPASGLQPDEDTLDLPLVDAGTALTAINQNLRGKAALIQRGGNDFTEKLRFAADAGAAFVVFYNHRDADTRIRIDSDFARIPSVFISQRSGNALRDLLSAGQVVRVHLAASPATYVLPVPETLICEQIVATVDTDHPRRGDLRITLVSPSGTRSVLQQVNQDGNPGPIQWSYMSVQYFLEPSAGVWRLEVTDEELGMTGNLKSLTLKILGTPITDSDRDGLDDNFERRFFGGLSRGPADDPDGDGFNNAREQAMRTDPTRPNRAFSAVYSPWNRDLARLSWPSLPDEKFEVLSATEPDGPYTVYKKITGQFPEGLLFIPKASTSRQYFQIRKAAQPE